LKPCMMINIIKNKPVKLVMIAITLLMMSSNQLSAQSYYGKTDLQKANSSDLFAAQQLSILIQKGKIQNIDSIHFKTIKTAVNNLLDSLEFQKDNKDFKLPIKQDSLKRVISEYADLSLKLTVIKITEIENSITTDTLRLSELQRQNKKLIKISE